MVRYSTSTPQTTSSRSSSSCAANTLSSTSALAPASNSLRRARSSLTVSDTVRRTSTASTTSTASSRSSSRPPLSAAVVNSKTAASPIVAAPKQATASRRTVSLGPRLAASSLSLSSSPLPSPPASSFAASRNALRSRDRNAALPSRPPLHHPTITVHRSPSTPSLASTFSSLSVSSPSSAKPPKSPKTPSSQHPMRPLKAPPSAMGYKDDSNTARKPTLAARPYARAPLTPKIASATTASGTRTPTTTGPSQATSPYQTVTVTPMTRRMPGLSSASTSHNDVASPVMPYLNITPRSGTRQNRVDSTTSNGPPIHAGLGMAGAADPDSKFFYASEAKPAAPQLAATAGVSSSAPTPTLAASPALGSTTRTSTFFYANGKSLPGTHSNGSAPTPPLASPIHIPSSMTMSQPTDHLSSKFVHANGDAIDRKLSVSSSQQPKLAAAGIVSASSPALAQSTSQAHSQSHSQLHSQPQPQPQPPPQSQSRPLSPAKVTYSMQRSDSARSAVMPASLSLNAATAAAPPLVPTSPGNTPSHLLSRPRSNFSASVGSSSSSGSVRSRKASLTVADPPTIARLMQTSQPSSEASSPAASQFSLSAISGAAGGTAATANTATSGLASLLQAADDFGDSDDESDIGGEHHKKNNDDKSGADDKSSNVHSNAGTDDSAKDDDSPLDALVKIARRERKVQDLEITNASLEAINRSLERQLRKQKTEIRQFRRLSRAGRLSSAPNMGVPSASKLTGAMQPPTGGTSRVTSSSTVQGPLQDTDRILAMGGGDGDDDDDDAYPSDMDMSADEDDEDDGHADDDEEDSDENMDNISSAKNKTRRRRDERRMQADLAKHRQLLVDSQKINQSIKRCMNWTEALINEGKKALAFQVRASEVQLGGRVLAEDEVEERRQQREERERLGLGATLPVDHDNNSMLGDGGSTLGVSDMGSVMGDGGSTVAGDTTHLDDLLNKDSDDDDDDDAPLDDMSADDASTFSAVDLDMGHVGKDDSTGLGIGTTTAMAQSPPMAATPSFALQRPPDEHDPWDTHDESFSPVTHSRTVRFDDDDVPAASLDASTTPKPVQGPFPIPA